MSDKLCCDCDYLNRDREYNDFWSGKTTYRCDIDCEYYKLDKTACRNFKEKSNSKYTAAGFEYENAGCYITTIVCNILSYEDDCELLTTLRGFREKFLKLEPEYIALLQEYDQVGPVISQKLMERSDRTIIAQFVFKNFLQPCSEQIKIHNYLKAIELYINMINYLKYKLNATIEINYDAEYDIETLGKGRVKTVEA